MLLSYIPVFNRFEFPSGELEALNYDLSKFTRAEYHFLVKKAHKYGGIIIAELFVFLRAVCGFLMGFVLSW